MIQRRKTLPAVDRIAPWIPASSEVLVVCRLDPVMETAGLKCRFQADLKTGVKAK